MEMMNQLITETSHYILWKENTQQLWEWRRCNSAKKACRNPQRCWFLVLKSTDLLFIQSDGKAALLPLFIHYLIFSTKPQLYTSHSVKVKNNLSVQLISAILQINKQTNKMDHLVWMSKLEINILVRGQFCLTYMYVIGIVWGLTLTRDPT